MHVRRDCAVQEPHGLGGPGRCPCTTASGNEAAQAGVVLKPSPGPVRDIRQAPLLTCSLLRADVLEAPCCLTAAVSPPLCGTPGALRPSSRQTSAGSGTSSRNWARCDLSFSHSATAVMTSALAKQVLGQGAPVC